VGSSSPAESAGTSGTRRKTCRVLVPRSTRSCIVFSTRELRRFRPCSFSSALLLLPIGVSSDKALFPKWKQDNRDQQVHVTGTGADEC